MQWLALDIGGANIKLSDGLGFAISRSFPMWRQHARLAHELRTMIAEAPATDHLAITMTGELADCFANRQEGVHYILDAVSEAADRRHTRIFRTDGTLVTIPVARQSPLAVAAANWLALAQFCGRFARPGAGAVIDMGSTTCDLIPLRDSQPVPRGLTDLQRLLAGELLYTGVERSPVCGVVQHVRYRQKSCPVAQELFATTGDVYVTLGHLNEDPAAIQTADHRPATRDASRVRLGRMIGAEGSDFTDDDARTFSECVFAAQRKSIAAALQQVRQYLDSPIESFVVSGQGEFLVTQVLQEVQPTTPIISLANEIGQESSRCGPAHALAVLAREAN